MNDVQETPLLNIEQASKYIHLSTATLARMRRDNNGPVFVRLGARVLYRKIDLDAYIDSATVDTTSRNLIR
jgi:predicted DNA-binding transcriptional regulator AlpA